MKHVFPRIDIALAVWLLIGCLTWGWAESVTISPSHTSDIRSFSLAASDSALFSVHIDDEGYILKSSTPSVWDTGGNFFWTGGGSGHDFAFSIVNSAWLDATAVAHVECFWAKGGSGGGAGGSGLKGVAERTATAGSYEDNGGVYEVRAPAQAAVGAAVEATAWITDGEGNEQVAGSDWTVGGVGQLQGSGLDEYSVQITASEAGDATVQGVYCADGSSDSKTIEFVDVEVEVDNTDEEDFFRSESDSMNVTVDPDLYADSLNVTLNGYDDQHWTATYNKAEKKITLENLIAESSPMAWLNEQMLSISAGIDGVAGEWNWTKNLELKKRMDGIKDAIMDDFASTLANQFETGPGQLAADAVSAQMKTIWKTDSNGIRRYFIDNRISELSDKVKKKFNGKWSDFTGTTIRGDVDSQDLHNQITGESWKWKWNTTITISATGGDVSVDQGGNPHLNPGDLISAVNDLGWSDKLFDPQKVSLSSSLTGDGHIGHALFKAKLFGELQGTLNGYEDPETHEMTNGGKLSGMMVGVLVEGSF